MRYPYTIFIDTFHFIFDRKYSAISRGVHILNQHSKKPMHGFYFLLAYQKLALSTNNHSWDFLQHLFAISQRVKTPGTLRVLSWGENEIFISIFELNGTKCEYFTHASHSLRCTLAILNASRILTNLAYARKSVACLPNSDQCL